jgi:hypothetical protein
LQRSWIHAREHIRRRAGSVCAAVKCWVRNSLRRPRAESSRIPRSALAPSPPLPGRARSGRGVIMPAAVSGAQALGQSHPSPLAPLPISGRGGAGVRRGQPRSPGCQP